jgi:iron complex outermembrane receptor protein
MPRRPFVIHKAQMPTPPPRSTAACVRPARLLLSCIALLPAAAGAAVMHTAQTTAQLADLPLEQLREVVVMTVSRQDERLDRAPASAYVISAEDIRRSGATTLPEALRLAPNLLAARADANQYAISARGFMNVLANKMLVLIDGRVVYTPLFSGVFWEAQDVMLEDVERIEVVSGPSTALWGTNAVNGLIHVITRHARETRGPAASVNLGNRERSAALRYGATLNDDTHVRGYAKAYDRDSSRRADGSEIGDDAHGVQAGVRADWTGGADSLTLQADAYRGSVDQVPAARRFSGVHALARWGRAFGDGAEASVQGYVERTRRDHPQTFEETLDTVDLVGQYGWRPLPDHQLLVGGGVRRARDDTTTFAAFAFLPARRTLTWTRLFAQDRIALSEALNLTLAASLEDNAYNGVELLPSARLAWVLDEDRTAWASLSRAARAPSRIDRDFFQPAQPPHVVAGGPTFESELSDVAELGWRARHGVAFSYSATLFHHEHRKLRSLGPTPEGLQFQNNIEGRTRGLEAWARWRVTDAWRVDGGFTVIDSDLSVVPGAVDLGGLPTLGNDPRHWVKLRSSMDLTPTLAWDVFLRHIGALPQPAVPSYTTVDMRLAWQAGPNTELALVGRNLSDPQHAEWGAAANRVEHERQWVLQWRWRLP